MKTSLLLGTFALLFGGAYAVVLHEAIAADTRLAPAGNRSQLPSVIQVLEPADGSAVARGGLRIRIAYAPSVDGRQVAEIKLTLQASRQPQPTGPVKGWGPQDPAAVLPTPQTVITWQAPLDALARGWLPPRDARIDDWNGPANLQIYVRPGQPVASSDQIVFTLGSNAQRQAMTPAAMSSAPPPVASRAALTAQANRYATPMEIVEPAAGSTATQGNLRVHVRGPTVASATQMAEVELSWLPPRPNGAAPPSPPAVRVKTWQAPLQQLTQGVVLPRDVTGAWTGPTLVRVRMAGAGESAWSAGVSFDLTSVAGRQATTSAGAPNWAAATSTQSAKAAQPAGSSLGHVNAMGSATAPGAPASALQSRP